MNVHSGMKFHEMVMNELELCLGGLELDKWVTAIILVLAGW